MQVSLFIRKRMAQSIQVCLVTSDLKSGGMLLQVGKCENFITFFMWIVACAQQINAFASAHIQNEVRRCKHTLTFI